MYELEHVVYYRNGKNIVANGTNFYVDIKHEIQNL